MKWHVNCEHALARQIKWVLADSDWEEMHLVNYVDELPEGCDVCRAFEQAAHVPFVGTHTVSMFSEKLRVDLLFLDHIIALRGMDVYSKYSLLAPLRLKNP